MKRLVTGAGGFIGRHVARHRCAADHQVLALLRPGAVADFPPPVRRVQGDLNTTASRRADLATCDEVIHLADRYRIGGVDRREMAAPNVAGTRCAIGRRRSA